MGVPFDESMDTTKPVIRRQMLFRCLMGMVVMMFLAIEFQQRCSPLVVHWVFLLPLAWIVLSIHAALFMLHYLYKESGCPVEPKESEEFRENLIGVWFAAFFVPLNFPFLLLGLAYPRDMWAAVREWFTYNLDNVNAPGQFRSPAGGAYTRRLLSLFAAGTVGLVIGAAESSSFGLRAPSVAVAIPLCASLALLPILYSLAALPLYLGALNRMKFDFEKRILAMRHSPVKAEREGTWIGLNVLKGGPAIIPRSATSEGVYIRGTPGSRKSVLIASIMEQAISHGDTSVHIFDLKGNDTMLLESAKAAAKLSGVSMKVQCFYDRPGYASHCWNLFEERWWPELRPDQQGGLIGRSLGTIAALTEHGKQWYGGAGEKLYTHTLNKHGRHIKSLNGMAEAILSLVTSNDKSVPKPVLKDGLQAWLDTSRMGVIEPLNVVGHPGRIDLCATFETPHIVLWRLQSAISNETSGAICRLVSKSLLTAAQFADRRCRVLIIGDEIQRAVGTGLSELLEQSRSSNISFILANQSLSALRIGDIDLRDTVIDNCRIHVACDIANPQEQKLFAEASGTKTGTLKSVTDRIDNVLLTVNQWGSPRYGWMHVGKSVTEHEVVENYLSLNDVKAISSDPMGCFVYLVRDDEDISWNGQPQVVMSPFIISKEEYLRRLNAPWMDDGPDTITVSLPKPPPEPPEELTSAIAEIETIERPKKPRRKSRRYNPERDSEGQS